MGWVYCIYNKKGPLALLALTDKLIKVSYSNFFFFSLKSLTLSLKKRRKQHANNIAHPFYESLSLLPPLYADPSKIKTHWTPPDYDSDWSVDLIISANVGPTKTAWAPHQYLIITSQGSFMKIFHASSTLTDFHTLTNTVLTNPNLTRTQVRQTKHILTNQKTSPRKLQCTRAHRNRWRKL